MILQKQYGHWFCTMRLKMGSSIRMIQTASKDKGEAMRRAFTIAEVEAEKLGV